MIEQNRLLILFSLVHVNFGLTHLFVTRYRFKRKMDARNESLGEDSPFLDPITDEVYSYLILVFRQIINPTLGLAGILFNMINVVVFYKMGISDGVTGNFFILAISDGLLATALFINKMTFMFGKVIRMYIGYGGVEQVVHIVFQASFYSTPYLQNYSLITTVVIAVVRCCCVAIPLKVKHILTARIQLAAILFLSGIATCVLVYVMAPISIVYVTNPETNTTLAFFHGGHWSTYAVFNNIVSFGAFIICIACVIILSTSLRRASRFRDSSTVGTSHSTNNGKTSAQDARARERQRNARVVRTVLLVCIIFNVCNVPNMSYFVAKVIVQGLDPIGRYKNTNGSFIMVAEMFLLISVCLNTTIYILYNTR